MKWATKVIPPRSNEFPSIRCKAVFKIENDLDVWYLKNFDKIEAVYQPREDNIVRVKSLVEEDKSSESKWGKFSGGQKLGRD